MFVQRSQSVVPSVDSVESLILRSSDYIKDERGNTIAVSPLWFALFLLNLPGLPRTVLVGSMFIENSREFTFNFDDHARPDDR